MKNFQEFQEQLAVQRKRAKNVYDMYVSAEKNIQYYDEQDIMMQGENIFIKQAIALAGTRDTLLNFYGEEKLQRIVTALFCTDEFQSEQPFIVEFDRKGWAKVLFPTPPVLKSKYAATCFKDLFCSYLQRKIATNYPSEFRTMRAAMIVYINHFTENAIRKQPFFDNDNLAIKAILDAAVPLLCTDDASKYCDNLYISQPDRRNFVELFLVEKSSFSLWKGLHQELFYCRDYVDC